MASRQAFLKKRYKSAFILFCSWTPYAIVPFLLVLQRKMNPVTTRLFDVSLIQCCMRFFIASFDDA